MKKVIGLVFLTVMVLLAANIVFAAEMSADMISTSAGHTFRGKIFISGDKVRMENPETISISRMDKKVVWILMPKNMTYMEQPFDPSSSVATSSKVSGEIERKFIAKENIDGRLTDKYQVVYNAGGRKETMFQWVAPGLNIPVKTAAADNSWVIEYKNIKTSKQPDSLFEVPAGYQKFSYQMPSMQDVLGGIIGG